MGEGPILLLPAKCIKEWATQGMGEQKCRGQVFQNRQTRSGSGLAFCGKRQDLTPWLWLDPVVESQSMVEKEIAVTLLACNLVRWTMAKAASLYDVLPRALSFAGTKRLLNTFADHLRRTPDDQVHTMITTILASIAALQLPHRPDRIEPRAKKRRPKNLPLLTVPRDIARELIRAQRLNRVP